MKATPIILILGAGAVGYYFYNKNKKDKATIKTEDPLEKAPVKKAPVKKAAVKKAQLKKLQLKK